MAEVKAYDKLSKEERDVHDQQQLEKEKKEQAELPYSWTQELATATVTVPLPKGTRGKDLEVVIGKRKLKVKLKSSPLPILEGELYNDIVVDDSSWTIDDGTLTVELDKLSFHIGSPQWWPHILTHHPTIDTTKINPAPSSLSDLDPKTRGMVEKMMWDNQQKALGRPTSDERKKEEVMKKFMAEHPEMDFNKAKIE
ncbi:nuclear movement protein nudC [Cryptococcus deuterogattii 99/473]|uniref:Nuclear movement protein nudC n=1 Tax=Cryptococcus deuterogattii Ram5 TaxID=1296110 RepID=A0A0D0UUA6_9TREE|nr:nuclear movement protein nudC [Cryptococcus deuterogattii Ram5]KIY57823.1 nuclear movement protein nudC [Cryptococcus deuterogattii 99/473]